MFGLSRLSVALFDQLCAWVRDGRVPGSSPVTDTKSDGKAAEQVICVWPENAVFCWFLAASISCTIRLSCPPVLVRARFFVFFVSCCLQIGSL